MTSLDGVQLFASGPHALRPGPWQRAGVRRGFAGVDGEMLLDMGRRSRELLQRGRLQAPTATDLQELIAAVEAFVDERCHVLVDRHGLTYQRVVAESFEATSGLMTGRGFWCDYTLRYRQLP